MKAFHLSTNNMAFMRGGLCLSINVGSTGYTDNHWAPTPDRSDGRHSWETDAVEIAVFYPDTSCSEGWETERMCAEFKDETGIDMGYEPCNQGILAYVGPDKAQAFIAWFLSREEK
jgi:hypothetical protein